MPHIHENVTQGSGIVNQDELRPCRISAHSSESAPPSPGPAPRSPPRSAPGNGGNGQSRCSRPDPMSITATPVTLSPGLKLRCDGNQISRERALSSGTASRPRVDPATNTDYVVNFADNSVSVIETATNEVTATISIGNYPERIAVDSGTHFAYVTNYESNLVSAIDAVTIPSQSTSVSFRPQRT
jgi:YVTN family beta-propeller protein